MIPSGCMSRQPCHNIPKAILLCNLWIQDRHKLLPARKCLHVSVSMILPHCLVKLISRTQLQYLREDRVYFVHGLFLLAGIGFRRHYYPTIECNRPLCYSFLPDRTDVFSQKPKKEGTKPSHSLTTTLRSNPLFPLQLFHFWPFHDSCTGTVSCYAYAENTTFWLFCSNRFRSYKSANKNWDFVVSACYDPFYETRVLLFIELILEEVLRLDGRKMCWKV